MDFIIDFHLPISLSKFIDKRFDCTSIHVNQILQKWNTTDAEISRYADENNLIVVTKDTDFKISHFINKTPKKVVRVTLGNINNNELCSIFLRFLPIIKIKSVQNSFYFEVSNDQLSIID